MWNLSRKSKQTSQKNIGATWSTHKGMGGCQNWFVLMEWGWISTHVWRLLQVSNYQEKPHGQSTGNTIVNLTKFVFSEQGVPKVIVSGHGPHYDCKSYKEFSKEWGFHHFMWSPRYLQSNRFNEPQLQTVKHTLDKSGQDPHMSLLCLRSTPVDSQLQSPAELLNQCKLHSNPPFWVGNLITDKDKINQWLTQRQQQMKYYHDRSATDLSPLTAGQPVHIQDQAPKKWLPGPINCTRPKPYSYEAKTQSGSVLHPASTEMIVTEPKDDPSAEELYIVPEPIKT